MTVGDHDAAPQISVAVEVTPAMIARAGAFLLDLTGSPAVAAQAEDLLRAALDEGSRAA